MNTKLTDITIIMDRSGSMGGLEEDTIKGFNRFLKDQQEASVEATLTLVQFDHEYLVVHSAIPIKYVPQLTHETYVPRGSTALLDAIGRAVTETGARLREMPEEDRPSKVLCVVITDGYENASREYNKARIKDMVTHQQEKYSWDFIFLGANMDAIAEGGGLGVAAACSSNYMANSVGTQRLYKGLSVGIRSYCAGSVSAAGILKPDGAPDDTPKFGDATDQSPDEDS